MSRRKTDLGAASSPQYTKSYSNIRGVDFSSDPSEAVENRAVNILNMYRDYDSEHGAAIETIPGYRRLFDFGYCIHGIWGYSSSQDETQEEYAIVHAGTKMFAFKLSECDSGEYKECFDGLADARSSAFLQNNNFYIADGTNIYMMRADLSVVSLEDAAYVPITYLSGTPYEQRNMLTDSFINRDTAVVGEDRYIKEGRCYVDKGTITKLVNMLWYPNGTGDLVNPYNQTDIFKKFNIKATRKRYKHQDIGDEMEFYLVTKMDRERILDEFDASAIQNSSSYYNDWYEDFGEITSELIKSWQLKRLIVRRRPGNGEHEKILELVKEGGIEEYFLNDFLDGMYIADVVIYDPCIEIKKVTVGGVEIPRYKPPIIDRGGTVRPPDIFYMPVREQFVQDGEKKWYVSFIHIYSKVATDLDTLEVDIYGVAEETKVRKVASAVAHTDYLNANVEYKGTSKEAILGCAVTTTFDGRVFLTGNSKLPNTVFYSCRDLTGYNNPAYFGVYNYFNDGVDNSPNVALLATSSVLMVMKQNTLHGSSIYYHTGAEGIDDVVPRIYPAVPGVAGIGCEGAALNFLDDAVFVSERGLEGVSKEALNLERTIGHRSSNIDRLLRVGDLSKASLCRWGAYLCLFTGNAADGGRVFLGDSRALFQGVGGAVEYEWFSLGGIGAYRGDHKRYRTFTYYPELAGGYTLADTAEGEGFEIAQESEHVDYSELKSADVDIHGMAVRVHFIEREGKRFICDSDGELEGGEFFPACVGYSANGMLYFGTTGGQICCFNTDKRGQAVDGEQVDSDRIHRSWYTFAGHGYDSTVTLKSDNCGVPHLTKRTTRKTCVLKLKSMEGSAVNVLVRTDREAYEKVSDSLSNTIFNFDDIDFENFSFDTDTERIVALKEKKKKWVEKQFRLESTGYMRPFGFYSLTYNYEIQGRVKK